MADLPAHDQPAAPVAEPRARVVRAFGTWASPVSARKAASGTRRLGMVQANRDWVLWTEGRPEEGGRQAIVGVRLGPEGPAMSRDVLAAPYSARSRVHEYGGGEMLLDGDFVYFVNARDQGIYRLTLDGDGAVEPIFVRDGWRFADFCRRGRWLLAVTEVHGAEVHGAGVQGAEVPGHAHGARSGPSNASGPRNLIVAIDLEAGVAQSPVVVADGLDFYAAPRISADGAWLAYLGWSLPDMPWDGARLYVTRVGSESWDVAGAGFATDGSIRDLTPDHGVVYCPQFAADGALFAVSDQSGYGQLMRWHAPFTEPACAVIEGAASVDFGKPLWTLATRTYSPGDDGRVVAVGLSDGRSRLFQASADGRAGAVDVPGDVVRLDEPVHAGSDVIAAIVAYADRPATVALLSLASGAVDIRPLMPSVDSDAREHSWIAIGRAETFRHEDGTPVPAIVYDPTSPTHEGPADTTPPTLVLAHGGPTSAANRALSLRIQFFTSRGFRVVDVDYAGSVGYGRAHRARLDGQWGLADVADCAAVARALIVQRRAAPQRVAIVGGSAGGYTVLMALATTDVFAAGSCHYGISDLALLDQHTHKFESGYQRRLIGGSDDAVYRQRLADRSPLTLVDRIAAPVIFFQGLDDNVVPAEQTRLMVASLRSRGVRAQAYEFDGEGHGFRKAATIETVLEAELAFFRTVLGLDGAV